MANAPAGPSRDQAHRMFDRISRRYDLLNRLLSLGMDTYWRKDLVRRIPQGEDLSVLDLATGTGDVALAIARKHNR